MDQELTDSLDAQQSTYHRALEVTLEPLTKLQSITAIIDGASEEHQGTTNLLASQTAEMCQSREF